MSKILFVLAAVAVVALVVDAVNQGKQQGHLTGFASGKHEAGFAPEKREAGFASEGEHAKPKRATDEGGPAPPPGSK